MRQQPTGSKSPHILTTSSNLLGFCLIVLTSLKMTGYAERTLVDEFTGAACILLMGCSLLSFLAIRSTNEKTGNRYETIADYLFISSLFLLSVICVMVAFSFMF